MELGKEWGSCDNVCNPPPEEGYGGCREEGYVIATRNEASVWSQSSNIILSLHTNLYEPRR